MTSDDDTDRVSIVGQTSIKHVQNV